MATKSTTSPTHRTPAQVAAIVKQHRIRYGDIAERAEVSIGTVCNIVTRNGDPLASNLERVNAALDEILSERANAHNLTARQK